MMEEQLWFCEICQKHGCVNLEEKEDVLSVARKIGHAHRSGSPECRNANDKIRVVNNEMISDSELKNIKALPVARV